MARKKPHESHGGAWKVAYADFVTAMMALFMVLWISSQDQEILIATSKYFNNPFSSPMPSSSGVMEGKKDKLDWDENAPMTRTFTPEMYAALAKEFLKLMDVPEMDETEKPIEVKVTSDGIAITIFNRNKQPVFEEGTTKLTEWGDYVSQNLAWIIDRFQMMVKVDAHTASGAAGKQLATDGKDNWNLTTDQANVMRQSLVHYGLEANKIDRVAGYADTRVLTDRPATDPSNSRLELTLSATQNTPRPKLR